MSQSKIKLTDLSQQDLSVISNAATIYAETLIELSEADNRSQQHIHLSILTEFRYELLKKLTKRDPPNRSSLKMEVYTAFVLYDSLQHYSHKIEDQLESAINRRIIIELFALLPFTKDHSQLSVMSNLNCNS